MKFSANDAARARNMRRRRLPSAVILSFFKGKYSEIEIDGLIVELRSRNANYRKLNYAENSWSHLVVSEHTSIVPPPAVLIEQAQRLLLCAKTTTALLCGDPLPGESALDRRQA